jgi:glycosyltransferase involved in cell wall biosynthesis
MNILIYTHSFAPQIGGVETYAMLLARGLSLRRGVNPVHVTLVTQTPGNNFNDGGLPFAAVRRPGMVQLVNLIRRSDVVHLAGPVLAPLLLSILLRKPVVIEHHGYQASCPNGLLLLQPARTACPDHFMRHEYRKCLRCNASESGWLASVRMFLLIWPRRWLSRRANINLCVTQHVATRLQLPHSAVVYHGVPGAEENTVAPAKVSEQAMGQSARPPVLSVAYLGRLVQEKGVPTLVEAIHLLQAEGKHVALIIIGDGPERPHLEAMASAAPDLQARISFTGSLQDEKLSAALAGADVLVMPSMNEEPAGLVVMEQMIRGCPVIVSDHGGGPELAGDGGLKFPPGDAAALAACLMRLVDEPDLLRELGLRARKRALAAFSLDRMVEEHYRMFERLASRAAR